jgi:hypothetical protein
MADAVFDSVITAGAAGVAGAARATGFGLAAAVVVAWRPLPEAHPINGNASTLAAVTPKPCCKNSLREAIAHP